MAAQQTAHGLSPQLGAVLGSLNISLEAELNRYRRDRRLGGPVKEDIFADIESDPSFDLEPVKTALGMALPPVPPNKKLLAIQSYRSDLPVLAPLALPASSPLASSTNANEPVNKQLSSCSEQANSKQINSEQTDNNQTGSRQLNRESLDMSISALIGSPMGPIETKSADGGIAPAAIVSQTQLHQDQRLKSRKRSPITRPLSGNIVPSSYLASSEKLIESIENTSTQLDSNKASYRPRRKTVSLLAGATLGFVGLAAGLGASYLMSNPLVAQRLANGLQGDRIDTIATSKAFDPPGPDLSGAEFVELEIDNLSSLQMPQNALISPGDLPPTPAIPSGLDPSSAPEALPASPVNIPAPASSSSTQAVVLPAGLTYYVTAPFTSERDLGRIRASISEAFVRQFSDGNRIQVAAFDNAESAQQFIEELKEKNIRAEVYGPTTE